MIQILREPGNHHSDWIESELRDLVVAFSYVDMKDAALLGEGHSLPAIQDGPSIISGKENLQAYLKDLAEFVRQWRYFEGDYCYVDEC